MSEERQKWTMTDERLIQFLSGDLDIAGQKEVEEWLDQSEDHRLRLLQLQVVWKDTGKMEPVELGELDVEAALANVRRRKEALQKEEVPSAFNVGTSWLLRIAAVLVLASTIALWFYANRSETINAATAIVEETLKDGSMITLEEGSQLEVLPFGSKRQVKLSGTGYFEVASDPAKPFTVEVGEVLVGVLGTKFSISQQMKQTVVSVEEGRVSVRYQDQELVLTGNETAVVDKLTNQLNRLKSSDTGEYRYWKTRKLAFKSLKLGSVLETLNRIYDADITVQNPAAAECLITVSFEGESLETIISVIALTLNLEAVEDNGKITLVGEGC